MNLLFTSFYYPVFLAAGLLVYYLAGRRSSAVQNATVLLISLLYYATFGVGLLPFIVFSVVASYAAAALLAGNKRKGMLAVSLIILLLPLVAFKYSGFILSALTGGKISSWAWGSRIAVPLGISFYTFQSVSYVADVYTRKTEREKNFFTHALFICFFPQIMSGPINRAGDLIPQINTLRRFNRSDISTGVRRFIFGLFKKVVIADGIGVIVDKIWLDLDKASSPVLIFGALLYSLQLYFDFAGYSDMAIASARLFGFTFRENFLYPYFSRSFTEFWRRWHISLSTWLRDYIYIPLGGNRKGICRRYFNLLIVFVVSGIWHGAGWTFIIWGLLHGLYRVAEDLLKGKRLSGSPEVPKWKGLLATCCVFCLASVANVFFRAPGIGEALNYLGYSVSRFSLSQIVDEFYVLLIGTGESVLYSKMSFALLVLSFVFTAVIDHIGYRHDEADPLQRFPEWPRFALIILMVILIFVIGQFGNSSFIYFNF